ncbi:hypothetical protein FNV43_RR23158 [Rhamnella rubrinervis]|uniref:VOC domain-containing protein n=1 Tax=Rhamnella rubrinervis TaxID=2594499 RepID=A0A8K0DWL3_9ROSA|nr:hypothetical protein FNV43_RR23158 [Rhamnella rubrinervis]
MSDFGAGRIFLRFDGRQLPEAFPFYTRVFGAVLIEKHLHGPIQIEMLSHEVFLCTNEDSRTEPDVTVLNFTTNVLNLEEIALQATEANAQVSYVQVETENRVEVSDPFGYRWVISRPVQPPQQENQQDDGWVQLPRLKFLMIVGTLYAIIHWKQIEDKLYEIIFNATIREEIRRGVSFASHPFMFVSNLLKSWFALVSRQEK